MEGRSLEDTIKYYDTRLGPFNLFLSWQFLYRTIAVLHYHRVCDIPRGIMSRRSELLRDNFLASSPPPTTSPFRGLPTQRGGDNSRNTNYRKILFFSISSREGVENYPDIDYLRARHYLESNSPVPNYIERHWNWWLPFGTRLKPSINRRQPIPLTLLYNRYNETVFFVRPHERQPVATCCPLIGVNDEITRNLENGGGEGVVTFQTRLWPITLLRSAVCSLSFETEWIIDKDLPLLDERDEIDHETKK